MYRALLLISALATSVPALALEAGQPAPDFKLPVAGAKDELSLAATIAKNKLTVVMWVSTQCPVSKAYDARMAQIAKDYAGKGVAFVGVNSNKAELPEEIVAHKTKNGFEFPVVKDAGNKVADLYAAKVTPEVYIVDPSGKVAYHGRIDEKQNPATPADVKSPDLKQALDALLAGKPAPNPNTKAFGCSIKRAG